MTRAADASPPERHPHVSLRGRTEFSRVYRSGKRRRVGEVLLISADGTPGPARVGVVAGRRVGNAVVRNRAKRRLREAVARAGLPEGRSYVIVALSDLETAGLADLVGWLQQGAAAGRQEMERGE